MTQPLTVYAYARCSTCRKASEWLQAKGVAFVEKPIYTEPPSITELRRMLALQGGEIRKLFNTSGLEYRARNLKEVLPGLSTEDSLALLASDGRLVKRPFVLAGEVGLVGFREEHWEKALRL